MRRGFSLTELLVAMAVAGVVAAMSLPAAGRWRARLAVDRAVRDLVGAHGLARISAVARGAHVVLEVRTDSLIIHPDHQPDSVVWAIPGPSAAGVALTGPSYALRFSPMGVSVGVSNGTWTFSRGGFTRSVIISRWGRIRYAP